MCPCECVCARVCDTILLDAECQAQLRERSDSVVPGFGLAG